MSTGFQVRNRLAAGAVWLLILAYVAFFGTLTVQKHNAFRTTAYDLGNVDQAVWNTRHGRPLAMTNIEGLANRLGTHVEPILLPISLIYFVWSDPRALLLLQTVVIALGAWPVYRIGQLALSRLEAPAGSRSSPPPGSVLVSLGVQVLPVCLSLVYLLFPALESANVFDFHAVSLAPTFFLLAFYSLERERWGSFALFALLTMSCKEDMPLLVAMLGLYALLTHRRRRWPVGLATIAVAGAWFLLASSWVMPHFDTSGVSPLASRYAHLGDGPVDMVVTLVTRPGAVLGTLLTAENVAYLRDLLTPVAFLPILAPQVLILAAPALAVNLLSSDGFMHQLEGFHYGVTLVPVAVVAAAYGAAWLLRRLPRLRTQPRQRTLPLLLAAILLAATLFYHHRHGYTPLAAQFAGSWPVVTDHHRLGQAMAGQIPTQASLAALPYLNPHASQREQLTVIDRVEDGLPAPLHEAEAIWLDVTNSWPLHPNDLKGAVENLLAAGYGIEQAVDGWLLLQRGSPSPEKALPSAFYDFARAPDAAPQYRLHLQFFLEGQPLLECLGFDLLPGIRLRFYWRALRPLPAGLRPYPFYLDDATGQVLEDTTLRPMVATVWYPPERWQIGEIIQTTTLPWEVGQGFSVGLGVVGPGAAEGSLAEAWRNLDQRLQIRVESSDLVVRLFDSNTWGRLIQVENGKPVEERRSFTTPAPQHPLAADLGQIRLLGYDLERGKGDTLRLTLYWQAQQRLGTSLTTFIQLLGPEGAVRAQVDRVPHDGGYPTVWWQPGEVVADEMVLALPASTPGQGAYRLIVGWYDPASGARLGVAGTGSDYVDLGEVEP